MEPLHPQFRQMLKDAHPGLTDDIIDRHEELVVRRFELDPDQDVVELVEIDRYREELIRRYMPHYSEVAARFRAARQTCDG